MWHLSVKVGRQVLENFGPWLRASWINPDTLKELEGAFLIDTGAGATAIQEDVALELRLEPVGQAPIITGSGPEQRTTYRARLYIPFAEQTEVGVAGVRRTYEVPSLSPASNPLGDDRAIGVIGRDVLALGVLTFDGPAGETRFRLDRAAVEASPFELKEFLQEQAG